MNTILLLVQNHIKSKIKVTYDLFIFSAKLQFKCN